MPCPRCNSSLYEGTPSGWHCSSCRYKERLHDLDVLVQRPGRNLHGNIWGEVKHPPERFDNGPFRVIRVGSFERYRELLQTDKRQALAYLQKYEFRGKNNLNRHYLAAQLCFELNRLKEARQHITICRSRLGEAKNARARYQVLELAERIDKALKEQTTAPPTLPLRREDEGKVTGVEAPETLRPSVSGSFAETASDV